MKAAREELVAAWSMTAQNSGSNEIEVRCPWMERERFCRPFSHGQALWSFRSVLALFLSKLSIRLFDFGASKFHTVLRSLSFFLDIASVFLGCFEMNIVIRHYRGFIINSGRTTLSNSFSVTKPRRTASTRRVVPFLWAVLATLVALS